MSFEAIKKQEQEYILHSYGRVDVALSHGKTPRLGTWRASITTILPPASA